MTAAGNPIDFFNPPKELWRNILHTDFYVSTYGRVFNYKSGKIVKPWLHKSRANYYWRVNIGRKKFMVHVLVASTFRVNLYGAAAQVDHLDGNTLNCAVWNLEWVTQSDNIYRQHKRKRVELVP